MNGPSRTNRSSTTGAIRLGTFFCVIAALLWVAQAFCITSKAPLRALAPQAVAIAHVESLFVSDAPALWGASPNAIEDLEHAAEDTDSSGDSPVDADDEDSDEGSDDAVSWAFVAAFRSPSSEKLAFFLGDVVASASRSCEPRPAERV